MAVTIAGMQATGMKAASLNSVSSTGKTSGGGAFAAMISSSMSMQDSCKGSTAAQPEATGKPESSVSAVKEEAGASQNPVLDKSQKTDGQIQEPEDMTEKPAEGVEEDAKALEEAVREVLTNVKEAVKDILKLDEDELNLLMEQMGITMADLLNPQVLQQLVVQAAGEEDVSVLLTDESLSGNLKELFKAVENIVEESGISRDEIVQQAVTENKNAAAADEAGGKEKTEISDSVSGKELHVSEDAKESSFQFEAVRETEQGAGRESSQERGGSSNDISHAEQFLNLVANAAPEAQEEAEVVFSQLSPAEQIREIADQILEKVRILVNPSQTSMEITLNPESLGKVSLSLISKQGIMTAQFTAQTQVAREAIESQMMVLRENLENQGVKVDAIEVTVSNFEFTQSDGTGGQEQQGSKSQQRRNITLEDAGFLDEVTEEEAIAIDMLERSGNSVDYTA